MSLNTILATTPLTSTNYVLKATGTTIGNSLIFDNGTNVGIGNTNTSYTLDVSGSLRNTTSAYFATTSGSVGIGTTSPTELLDVNGAIKINNYITARISSYTSYNLNAYYDVSTWRKGAAGYARRIQMGADNGGSLQYSVSSAAGSAGDAITWTDRVVITDAGNVGIGTSSPSSKLNIIGGEVKWGFTSDLGSLSYSGGNPIVQSIGATSLLFNTNGSERMAITSVGLVYIKQAGNTFNDGLRIYNTGLNYWGVVAGGDGDYYFGYNGNAAAKINSAGTYTAFSDRNRKKDFEESTIGLNAILGLKPTLYRIKTDDETVPKQLGFIAQEVKDFIPQAYSESMNGDEIFIGLNYNPIIAALVKAIQEMNTKSEEQQALITSLQSQINAIVSTK
jgi:hypothetical protein